MSNNSAVKKNNSLKVNPLVAISFCFLLYAPTLKIMPLLLEIISIIAPLLYIALNLSIVKKVVIKQSKLILLAFSLVILSILVPMLHGTTDFSYLSVTTFFFRKALVYLALLCLIVKKHNEYDTLRYFMCYFALTHVIHVLFTIILVAFPATQNAWFSIFVKDVARENLLDVYGYAFRLGWQGFAGFRLTLYCSISAIFALYLRYGSKRQIGSFQFFYLFIGNVIGNMFYGRSGLIATILITSVSLVYWNRKRIKNIILFLAAVLLFVFCVVVPLKDVPMFHDWYRWMSRPIVSLVETGEMNDSSFEILKEMNRVEIPDDTLFFGDGYYMKDGHYYMKNDSGYIRAILFWGLAGALISYAIVVGSIFSIRKISAMLAIQLLFLFLIFEYKGAVYYEFLPLVFAMTAAYTISKHGIADEKRGLEK